MTLRINDVAPNFSAMTTEGRIRFHDWMDDGWAVMFSHPKDFTPVCTTELAAMAALVDEFDRRDCRVIGVSVDSLESHRRWKQDIFDVTGRAIGFPIVADTSLKVSKLYRMLPASAGETCEGRSAIDNATVRTVFIISPEKRIKLTMTYPMSTGRNFAEILRVLDALQLTAAHRVATPADWSQGEDVIIAPYVADEDAKALFPAGWTAPKPYLRYVKQPRDA